MSSRSLRTKLDGTTTTRTGRVVYNRKTHIFTERDAARITRRALDFPRMRYWVWTGYGLSRMDEAAKYNFQSFCDYAGRWNFFPKSMIREEWDDSPVQDFAAMIAFRIAGQMGAPDWAVDIASILYSAFVSGHFSSSFKLDPAFSSMIVQGVRQNTRTEGEIYGSE